MESTNYLTFENAKLIFKNFKGEKTQFNREGNKNFCVVIENAEDAEALKNDGWNVKQLSSKDDEEDVLYYLPVAVAFDPYPPRVELIGGRRVLLDEENISTLDQVDIKTVDLVLRPYTPAIQSPLPSLITFSGDLALESLGNPTTGILFI